MSAPYRLDAPAHTIAAALGAAQNGDVWEGGAVVPGGYAPVAIRDKDGLRRLVPRQWGVPPPPRGEHTVTTVRNLASPFWIGTLRHTQLRCLVPVTRFVAGRSARRWFSLPSRPVFALAGVWRDSEVPSFAFLTTEPNRLASSVDAAAMPVILHPEDYGRWLSADWKEAQQLVGAYPSQLMRMDEALDLSP